MSKLSIAVIFLISVPLAAGLAWVFAGMLPRLGDGSVAYLGGLFAVPLAFIAVALVVAEERA